MHGLINRSLQNFLQETYGVEIWRQVAAAADLGFDSFEAMMVYDPAVTEAVLDAAAARLGKRREIILEDLGTYLVSSASALRLRRLLRYGGDSFIDFLQSLDDLPDRARLAVPDLEVPRLTLHDRGEGLYHLSCSTRPRGMVEVVMGVLRAMADDYGALVFIDCAEAGDRPEECLIQINVLSTDFAEGRSFELTAGRA